MPARSSLSAAPMLRNGTTLLVLAGVLWGTGGLAGSILASYTGLAPVAVAAYRLLIGGTLITGYALVSGRLVGVPRDSRGLFRIAAAGLLLACYQAAYFAAVAATSVGLATLTTMVAVSILITAGTAFLDRRPPTRRAIVSLVIALAGLVLLIGSPTAGAHRMAGTGLALLAAAGFAALSMDRRETLPGLDHITTIGLGFLAGGLLLLPITLTVGMAIPARPAVIGAVLFLGLVPTAVAYSSYFTGLRYAGSRGAIIALFLEPLTATLLAALVNHEHLTGAQILGVLFILFSTTIRQDSAA
ncbi:DMT family transporter [Streptomyces sp. TG1A-8]|uniref:DMT family transporter n=1 Tax=Streptomyces sp. TG1A-8 TaxID=3051385 RepID=UPI00265BA87C|nr:DMT family transporter [Streptomyces sp. TG1A-8]MDO0930062.1 DMT family transporter [Streptomyces sp. TG1A-8]